MTRTRYPHPHKPEEKEELSLTEKRFRKLQQHEESEGVRLLMSSVDSRREVYELLRSGYRVPGMMVSNTNGSLQSYQLGRFDALRDLDERIRMHCNDLWIQMLEENASRNSR